MLPVTQAGVGTLGHFWPSVWLDVPENTSTPTGDAAPDATTGTGRPASPGPGAAGGNTPDDFSSVKATRVAAVVPFPSGRLNPTYTWS